MASTRTSGLQTQFNKTSIPGASLVRGLDIESSLPDIGTSSISDNIKIHNDYVETFSSEQILFTLNEAKYIVSQPISTTVGSEQFMFILARNNTGKIALYKLNYFTYAYSYLELEAWDIPESDDNPPIFQTVRIRDRIFITVANTPVTARSYIYDLSRNNLFYQGGLEAPSDIAVDVPSALVVSGQANFAFNFAITYNYGDRTNGAQYGETDGRYSGQVNTVCDITNETYTTYKADGTVDHQYQWGENHITIRKPGDVPNTAVGWNIYMKRGQKINDDQTSFFCIAKNLPITQNDFGFTRQTPIMLSKTPPINNTTYGIKAGFLNVINNRIWATRFDGADKYAVCVSQSVDTPFAFDMKGANRVDVSTGTNELPLYVGMFRTNTGESEINLLTGNQLGAGKRYLGQYIDVNISEGVGISQLTFSEQLSSVGCVSSGSVVNKNNDLIYLSHLGFMNTTTNPQMTDVLANNAISNNIITLAEDISFTKYHLINNYYAYDTIYWKVFDLNGFPYILTYNDIAKSWSKIKPKSLKDNSILFNIEHKNQPTLAWSYDNKVMIEGLYTKNEQFEHVNYETNYVPFDDDFRRFAQIECVIISIKNFEGYFDFTISGTKNSGGDTVKTVRIVNNDENMKTRDYHDNEKNYIQGGDENPNWFLDTDLPISYVNKTDDDDYHIHIPMRRFVCRRVKFNFETLAGSFRINQITVLNVPLGVEKTFKGLHSNQSILFRK